MLPVKTASNLGAWVGRNILSLLPYFERVDRNLQLVMPELSAAERRQIGRQVWENLGRVASERVP